MTVDATFETRCRLARQRLNRPTRSADIAMTATAASRPSDEICDVTSATAVNAVTVTVHIAGWSLYRRAYSIRRRSPSGTIDCPWRRQNKKGAWYSTAGRPYSRMCSPTIASIISVKQRLHGDLSRLDARRRTAAEAYRTCHFGPLLLRKDSKIRERRLESETQLAENAALFKSLVSIRCLESRERPGNVCQAYSCFSTKTLSNKKAVLSLTQRKLRDAPYIWMPSKISGVAGYAHGYFS